MKILFVSHRYPPAHTAGTETYAYNLARRLNKNHDLQVFHAEKRLNQKQYALLEEEADGVKTWVMINNLCHNNFGETFLNPGADGAFMRVLDRFEPDMVHIHHLMYLSLNLPKIAKERGIPVVMTLHDFFLECARGGRLMLPNGENCQGPSDGGCPPCLSAMKYRQSQKERTMISLISKVYSALRLDLTGLVYFFRDRVFKRDLGAGIIGPIKGDPIPEIEPWVKKRKEKIQQVYDAVSVFMTPSNTVGEKMKQWGLPEKKLKLWRLGIDLKPFLNIKREKRKTPVFGCFSTFMPHKGIHVLVQAAASLDPDKARVVIRGDQSQNPAYVKRLMDMAGPAVSFLPGYKREEVGRAFEGIDVLVQPSLWVENSPVAIQEAFASKVPVITSDLGGMKELVTDHGDGRLFQAGDVKALSSVLREIADQPELLNNWRKQIRSPRSIEDDVQSMEALYQDLIKG